MIRVGLVVVGLDEGEPVLQGRLGALHRLVDFEADEGGHAEPHQAAVEICTVYCYQYGKIFPQWVEQRLKTVS